MDKYDIEMEAVYKPLQKISIQEAKKLSDHHWFNRTLCDVNDSLIRLGVFDGKFHYHLHQEEDEFFFVIDGYLEIDIENQILRQNHIPVLYNIAQFNKNFRYFGKTVFLGMLYHKLGDMVCHMKVVHIDIFNIT